MDTSYDVPRTWAPDTDPTEEQLGKWLGACTDADRRKFAALMLAMAYAKWPRRTAATSLPPEPPLDSDDLASIIHDAICADLAPGGQYCTVTVPEALKAAEAVLAAQAEQYEQVPRRFAVELDIPDGWSYEGCITIARATDQDGKRRMVTSNHGDLMWWELVGMLRVASLDIEAERDEVPRV